MFHLIRGKIDDGSFGYKFPEICPDSAKVCGCNHVAFESAFRAEIPDLESFLPLQPSLVPNTIDILDLLEFCTRAIAKPVEGRWHDFFRHSHLGFNREEGLMEFVADVNRLFARNGIAFELTPEGTAVRIGPPLLREELASALFQTGDAEADRLLERARREILSPKIDDRYDALEKLWDAFERIKTLENADKNTGAAALLDKAAQAPRLRGFLEKEARELTKIGNELQIRHFETTKEKIERAEQVDYLFHRMFSFVRLALRMSERSG